MTLDELFNQVGARSKCESDAQGPLHCGGGSATQANHPDCTQGSANASCTSNTVNTPCVNAFTTC